MRKYKNLIKSIKTISVYFGATLIPSLLNLLINPLVALNMTPSDYAIVGYYTSFNTLLSPLIIFYFLHFYTKSYFELNVEKRIYLKATIFKSLIYFSIFLALLCLLGLVFYCYIFNKDSLIPIFPYVIISVMSLPLTGVYSLILIDYRMERKSKSFFNVSVLNSFFLVLITLSLVVFIKLGAIGKLASALITNFVFFLWAIWHNRELFKIKFDKKKFKQILVFCFPLTLAAMLGFFSNGYDRILLEKLGDITELGYYVVGVQIAGYIKIFSTSISSTFQPDIYESIVKRNFRRTAKFVFFLVFTMSIIVFVFILFSPILVDLLTAGKYVNSVKYTQVIALSSVTSIMYYSLSQITIALGKTIVPLINKIVSSILILFMFSFLIHNYGFMGAAWGVVFSFLISLLGNILFLFLFKKNVT